VFKRGEAPLSIILPPPYIKKGKFEGALAPSETIVPLPLVKGKGIQGIGFLNKNLMGVR